LTSVSSAVSSAVFLSSSNPCRNGRAASSDVLGKDIPLLPNESPDLYKDLGDRFPGGERYPGFTGFLAARMAALYAYGMAGVVDPTEDLDLVELHDAFTISDIQLDHGYRIFQTRNLSDEFIG